MNWIKDSVLVWHLDMFFWNEDGFFYWFLLGFVVERFFPLWRVVFVDSGFVFLFDCCCWSLRVEPVQLPPGLPSSETGSLSQTHFAATALAGPTIDVDTLIDQKGGLAATSRIFQVSKYYVHKLDEEISGCTQSILSQTGFCASKKWDSPYIRVHSNFHPFSDSSFHFQLLSIALPPFDFGLAAAWPCIFLGAICQPNDQPKRPPRPTPSLTPNSAVALTLQILRRKDHVVETTWRTRHVETKAMESIVTIVSPFLVLQM